MIYDISIKIWKFLLRSQVSVVFLKLIFSLCWQSSCISVVLMKYSHWAEPGPRQGLGPEQWWTIGLSRRPRLMCNVKVSTQYHTTHLFSSLSRSSFHVWIHHKGQTDLILFCTFHNSDNLNILRSDPTRPLIAIPHMRYLNNGYSLAFIVNDWMFFRDEPIIWIADKRRQWNWTWSAVMCR